MSPEQRTGLFQRMSQIGRSVGIAFRGGGKIGSTRDAHRLIHLSQAKQSLDIQNALVEGLFEAYHELEKDISSHEVLREIATGAGLDGSEVDRCLSSGSSKDQYGVDDEAQRNKKTVGSVPVFFIQGVHRIDGAQDITDFLEIFAKVREDEASI